MTTQVGARPTKLGSWLSVTIAAGCVLVVAGLKGTTAVTLTLVGLFGLTTAVVRQWTHTTGRLLVGACGVGLVVAGLAVPMAAGREPLVAARLYPGLAGLVVLTGGLVGVRRGWETRLATAGTGLVFLGVLVGGITYGSGRLALLIGTAGTIAAWDAARHAITLGEQVGQQATTWQVELRHVGTTALVGAVLVGCAELLWRLNVTGLPLEGLLFFLGAALALLVALSSSDTFFGR